MRRILVERARLKRSVRHGGERRRVELDDVELAADGSPVDLIAPDEALDKLCAQDSQKAELVKLRCFTGLSNEQAAKALDISVAGLRS